MPRYRRVPARSISDLRAAPGNDEPVEPPVKQSPEEMQGVLDDAHEQGILEEPAKADEARKQGVVAARIDTVDGEQVLVETVEPKPRKSRKAKA